MVKGGARCQLALRERMSPALAAVPYGVIAPPSSWPPASALADSHLFFVFLHSGLADFRSRWHGPGPNVHAAEPSVDMTQEEDGELSLGWCGEEIGELALQLTCLGAGS